MNVERIDLSSFGSCSLDGHCITCSDEALPARVVAVDDSLLLAQVEINGQLAEIDISLVDGVVPGDLLLAHSGVALERLGSTDGTRF
jgi:hydrogenase maturation factor